MQDAYDGSADWLTLLLPLAIVLGLVGYGWYISNHGELADKPAYAELQGLEFSSRSQLLPPAALRKDSGGNDVLGVKNSDARFPMTWIMLGRLASDGGVLAVPRLELYRVVASCVEVQHAVHGARVDPAVMRALESHCAT